MARLSHGRTPLGSPNVDRSELSQRRSAMRLIHLFTVPAAAGVLLHGLAADAVAQTDGERGLLASDLLPELRRWMNRPAC